jgi:hypothetical protein
MTVGGLSPLDWFFVGVVSAGTSLALFWFILTRGVAEHRRRHPELSRATEDGKGCDDAVADIRRHLHAIEQRLAELESQVHRQVPA